MGERNKTNSEIDKQKQKRRGDGKKMVKQSLLILLFLVSVAIFFGLVEGTLNHLGVKIPNIFTEGFFSIWAIAAVFAIIGLYIGSVLWFDFKSNARPFSDDRGSIANPQNAGNPNSFIYKMHHRS